MYMANRVGFEPTLLVLETNVLPLTLSAQYGGGEDD